jgi:succinate-semialdehyde dehydrogenase
VVLATGGGGMVKSAYSSGKPSFGVGPGNVQGLVDDDVDFDEVAKKVIQSRIYDNGIICSATQTQICTKKSFPKLLEALKKNGAAYFDDAATVAKFRDAVFPGGKTSKDAVGQSVQKIAELAGVSIPAGTKEILLKPEKYGKEDSLSGEKMWPMQTIYEADDWKGCIDIAMANLQTAGAGHSVDIQSNTTAHIEEAAVALPASRFLVNQICTSMNGGAFQNSLSPTTTLGCGSWGNNSISENLSWRHLINHSRIAFVKADWRQPSDEEIWS